MSFEDPWTQLWGFQSILICFRDANIMVAFRISQHGELLRPLSTPLPSLVPSPAAVANMEFMQFHPTCLYNPTPKTPDERRALIAEALRGKQTGGKLVLTADSKEDLVLPYSPLGSAASRDVVALAIDTGAYLFLCLCAPLCLHLHLHLHLFVWISLLIFSRGRLISPCCLHRNVVFKFE